LTDCFVARVQLWRLRHTHSIARATDRARSANLGHAPDVRAKLPRKSNIGVDPAAAN